MKRNKKIISLLAAVAITASMNMFSVNAFALENSTNPNSLSQVNISSVRPQDDFYEAINGQWQSEAINNIRDHYTEKSTYTDIRENNEKLLKDEFMSFVSDKNRYGENSDERKMADVYENYINWDKRNTQGTKPIEKYISEIDKVKNLNDLNNLLGNEDMDLFSSIIKFDMQENSKINAYEIYIGTTTLSLIDSNKYKEGNENTEYKSKVINFYTNLLKKSGFNETEAKEMIDNLFKFESYIAPSILSTNIDESQIDKSKCDVLVKIDDLNEIAPNINIPKIMKSLKLDNANYISVSQVEWLKKLNELWTQDNLPLIKNYLKVNLIKSTGRYLTEDMDKLYYDFMESILGVDFHYSSINDEAYDKMQSLFPNSLGKLYCEKTLTKEEENDIGKIASEIMTEYKKEINNSTWISSTTKKNLVDKLNKIEVNVGYSGSNQDYSDANIRLYSDGGNLLENITNLAKCAKKNGLKILNSKIDKDEITNEILPQDIIAEYHVLNNSIIISPGILQPELYNINYTREKKLAGIGIVIAHEISHSLDIIGAFFDGQGELKNMWTEDDFNKFKEKALNIKDYYSKIEALPGEYIDGELTLCENMADIGAMSCILDLLAEKENSDYKLFFEEYARAYKCVKTKEGYEDALKNDEHSPDKIRVNAILSQFQKFYDTYGIKENDKMYVQPESRVEPFWK